MEEVKDDDSLMTLREAGTEVFRVQATYQNLEESKKIEMLHILLNWVNGELDTIKEKT